MSEPPKKRSFYQSLTQRIRDWYRGTEGDSLAPYVPSPPNVVEKMLRMAELKEGNILYDLGCGDGRIVIMAAQRFGANCVGVELDDGRYHRCVRKVRELQLQGQVKIVHGNAMDISLKDADVVTLYLLTKSNEKLKPNFERDLKPGARVVSHDFSMLGWTPTFVEEVKGSDDSHTIYMYRR
jgi:ubiquinone/menaquinone biosynthesis C-methylase UbiE